MTRMSSADKPSGKLKARFRSTANTSGNMCVMVYAIVLLRLSKIVRPSRMPMTTDEKSSSIKITSAASYDRNIKNKLLRLRETSAQLTGKHLLVPHRSPKYPWRDRCLPFSERDC